jgi:hypothetical protein
MKGKRRAGEMQTACDLSRRETFWRVPHQKSKDIQPRFLRKGSK